MLIEVEKIKIKSNFRKDFGDINVLKNNINERGLLQPIVITDDHFLVAGERRLRAIKELGWKEVECVLRKYEADRFRAADGVFENLKRKSLTPDEEAAALLFLKNSLIEAGEVTTIKDTGRGQKKNNGARRQRFDELIAKEIGQSPRTVRAKVKIGEALTPKLTAALKKELLSQKQAEVLASVKDSEVRDSLVDQVAGQSLSETKKIIKAATSKKIDESCAETNKQLATPLQPLPTAVEVHWSSILSEVRKQASELLTLVSSALSTDIQSEVGNLTEFQNDIQKFLNGSINVQSLNERRVG